MNSDHSSADFVLTGYLGELESLDTRHPGLKAAVEAARVSIIVHG